MRIGWLWIVFACLYQALAQVPPRPAAFAAIGGVVIHDVTGLPIRRAAVTLSTLDEPPLEALTFTAANGVFGFHSIPPGKYQLRVDLDGFQQAWFGAASSKRPPATLKLSAGDLRSGITFRLRPLGSLSGVVYDPEGDPLPNVSIRLLKAVFDRLKPTYENEGWANTDDRGRYRLADVLPGQYVLMAAEQYGRALLTRPELAPGQTVPEKMYAAQFYPEADRLSAADPIQMAGGQDLDGLDFHLSPRAIAVLRGKVVVPAEHAPSEPLQVVVSGQEVPNTGYQSFAAVAMAPDYVFEIPNLIAGPYLVAVRFSVEGRDYSAAEHIDLPPGGQELTLHPERAIDLAGRLDLEGTPPPAGPFRVVLSSGGGSFAGLRQPSPRADVQPDGTFLLPNVLPGIWDIDVQPVPPDGFVKSMRLGGQDVLAEDMTIDPNSRESLRIVVSTRGAVVSGTVRVPPGIARSPRAAVLLAPCGKYAQVLSFYAQTASDDDGHFEIKGVTPGQYKLYAFEELDATAYQDPGFLKPYEASSAAFAVAEGAHVDRETQLILTGTQVYGGH